MGPSGYYMLGALILKSENYDENKIEINRCLDKILKMGEFLTKPDIK